MPDDNSGHRRLDSWKDIAAYLGHDVRTAFRWERERGLPIHRLPGSRRGSVYAYTREIDDWLAGYSSNSSHATKEPTRAEALRRLPHSGRLTRVWRFLLRPSAVALLTTLLVLAVTGIRAVQSHTHDQAVHITGLARLTDNGLQKQGLLTDGSVLYFSEMKDGKNVLSVMPINGGRIRQIPSPFTNAWPEDLSKDGKRLLVLAFAGLEMERALWIVPARGATPQRVGTVWCHAATWSPDGRSIAYASGKSIYVTSDDWATSQELGTYAAIPETLRWSPDGRYIRFLLENPFSLQFSPWQLDLDAHPPEAKLISSFEVGQSYGTWAWAHGGHEFFLSSNRNDEGHIWISRSGEDQRNPEKPTELNTTLGDIGGIAADARAGKLFVISWQAERGELFRSDRRTHEVAPFLPGLSAVDLDFSPDGQRIAYVKLPGHTLWTSRADGTEAKQLTAPPLNVELPRWSPDARRLAFTANQPGKPWRIYVVSPEGGALQQASRSDDNQGAPTWSPDGRSLAYANVMCEEAQTCAVHRIDVATGKVSTLPDSYGLRTARWSPDGRYIAALQPLRQDLLVFNRATRRWKKLAGGMNGDDLAWSRDSRYLYTDRPTGDRPEVVRVSAASGRMETVVDLSSFEKLSGKFGGWFCLTPDGSLVLMRWLNSSDIYALDWGNP